MTGQGSFWFGSSDFYPGVATRSLRFNDGSSEHLTFTPSSASSAADRRKITHSVWIKRGVLGTYQTIYSSTKSGGGDYYSWRFNNDNTMTIFLDVDDSNFAYDGTEVYRDISNWYHFVLIIDTTQSSASNRIKLYANGVQQTLSNKYGSNVSQNFETYVMDGTEDAIGEFNFNNTSYFDGYMCDFITTIGQDTSISDFGETKNGVWIAKDYSGSYGANGFRLQFDQTGTGTASASTIGADVSGNTNHWTSNNLASGDSNLSDSPENNLATLNPLYEESTASTFSEGNLKISGSAGASEISTIAFRGTQKFYYEVKIDSISSWMIIGILATDGDISDLSPNILTDSRLTTYGQNGAYYTAGSYTSSGGFSYTTNDVIGIKFDNGTMTPYKNGVAQTPVQSSISTSKLIFAYVAMDNASQGMTVRFAEQDWTQAPTGVDSTFELSSTNLDDVTIGPDSITQADDHFNTVLYTGNDGTQTITGVGFQPDWVWIKARNQTRFHNLFDSSRGTGKNIRANSTNAEVSDTDTLTAFASDGFSLGDDSEGARGTNYSSDNYVAWNWKANGGTTSSNTAGDITSTVQVNTDAGFSIVTYTSTNTAGDTVGHGLGKVPAMIITKNREDDRNWGVYHHKVASDPETDGLFLNLGNSVSDSASYWNDTAPTSTVFSLGSGAGETNFPASDGFVAYCFAEIEGYSKFGTYTGNNSTDGPFVYTGFRPAFLMLKRSSDSGSWQLLDNKRNTFNPTDIYLYTPGTGAEVDGSGLSPAINVDFLSSGLKIRSTEAVYNSSDGTFVYMAFAEQPFKFSNAR